jgi:membrane-bound serine protease (ClpP class)
MIGETGEVISELNPIGRVLVHGEMWNAKTLGGIISAGEKIKVTAVQNLTLQVERLS